MYWICEEETIALAIIILTNGFCFCEKIQQILSEPENSLDQVKLKPMQLPLGLIF